MSNSNRFGFWILCSLLFCTSAFADDWPQFRGSHMIGKSSETGLLKEWPENGPAELWSVPLGSGYGGASIYGNEVFVLDREVGQFKLHPKVAVIAAGNLASDRAIVNRLSTAMQSRMIHLQITVDRKAWVDWANSNKIDYRVVAYINFKPEILQKFDANHDDFTFPCPRTWEFVSDLIKPWPKIEMEKAPIIDGAIGEGAAREFLGFCAIFQSLPTIDQILANPTGVDISEEPSVQHAISGLMSHHLNTQSMDTLYKCITRLPVEFQVLCLQAGYRKKPEIDTHAKWKEWTVVNAQNLI